MCKTTKGTTTHLERLVLITVNYSAQESRWLLWVPVHIQLMKQRMSQVCVHKRLSVVIAACCGSIGKYLPSRYVFVKIWYIDIFELAVLALCRLHLDGLCVFFGHHS